VKVGCIAGQNDDGTWRIRLQPLLVELLAQANGEYTRHDGVDPILWCRWGISFTPDGTLTRTTYGPGSDG
jgi:hypothetical protein